MPLITINEAQAWGEKTKLAPVWLSGLDNVLLAQIEAEVIGRISTVADATLWIDTASTPPLVKTIIAKMYVAWIIDRQYSEDEELSAYAALLRATALQLQQGIVDSEIDIPGVVVGDAGDGLPSSYPTDTDPSCGPYFRMDTVF
jgi:hypothetical protein